MYNNRFVNRYSPEPEHSFDSKLKNISPVKQKIIKEIQAKSKNKSIEQLLPEIMQINQELNKRNMNFTKEESTLLLNAIEETLDSSDKQRFQMLKSLL